jgi:G3E family GTPase
MGTQVILISGFLGAGKTSFLKHVLGEQAETVGVLVNEFGKISIDGPVLQKDNMNLIELNNGSIFCSCIKEHFIQSLKELISKQLDTIYIESSGLADPSNMLQIVELIHKELPFSFNYKGSICIVDSLYFDQELKKMVSVERQIKHSQVVIINKVDLVDPGQVEIIHQQIKAINQEVRIYCTSFGRVDIKSIEFSQRKQSYEGTTNKEDNRPFVIIMRLEAGVTMENIQGMVEQIKAHFYRIKGIIREGERSLTIDTVLNKLDISDYEEKEEGEQIIVLISAIGVTAVSYIIAAAEKWIPGLYLLET